MQPEYLRERYLVEAYNQNSLPQPWPSQVCFSTLLISFQRSLHLDIQIPFLKMSQLEIYHTAKLVRAKLLNEASFKDHNLFRLVGHANLYDKLVVAYSNCTPKDEPSIDTHGKNAAACHRHHSTSSSSTNWIEINEQNLPRISKPAIKREGWHLQEGLPSYQDEKDRDVGCKLLDEFMAVSIREVEIADDND
jgi:hypothetical protein